MLRKTVYEVFFEDLFGFRSVFEGLLDGICGIYRSTLVMMDRKPRLFINERCHQTIFELGLQVTTRGPID